MVWEFGTRLGQPANSLCAPAARAKSEFCDDLSQFYGDSKLTMVNRKLAIIGSLSAATVLISFINLYRKESSNEHFLENSRLFTNLESFQLQRSVSIDGQLPVRKTKGYLLALYVLEQLTMSSAHYISLLNLAHSWKLTGVEPTICHSRMYGLPGISSLCNQQYAVSEVETINSVEIEYSRLYNLSLLNSELNKCLNNMDADRYQRECDPSDPSSCRVIESLDDFIHSSHRDIVLVHFVHGIGGSASRMTFLPPDVMQRFGERITFPVGNPIINCTQLARETGLMSVIEQMLNKLASKQPVFTVKRAICINIDRTKQGLDAIHLKNAVLQSVPNVSVVFTKWQNRGIIGEGSSVLSRCKVSPIHHSGEVIAASKRYLSSMNVKQPFLSVHLRLERLYQCEDLIPGYTNCCVERISSLISKVLHKYGINKKDVLIIKDYGQYGTDSCTYKRKYVAHSICMNLTRDFFTNVQKYGYSPSEFLPADFNGVPDNSAFVSLVEAGAILSGSVLIASGFGSYQGTVIKQFIGSNDPAVTFKHFDNKHRYGNSSQYNRVYRVCTCTPLKGHLEKLNGIDLKGHSCEQHNN